MNVRKSYCDYKTLVGHISSIEYIWSSHVTNDVEVLKRMQNKLFRDLRGLDIIRYERFDTLGMFSLVT